LRGAAGRGLAVNKGLPRLDCRQRRRNALAGVICRRAVHQVRITYAPEGKDFNDLLMGRRT